MLGNFTYCNPTRVYFGEGAITNLENELNKYGDNITIVYGKGSIKKNGIYDNVCQILKDAGKNISEIEGVMPNPTYDKVKEGIQIVKDNETDLLLAVGGGSVCDYSKMVAASVHCQEDPWEKYLIKSEAPECQIIPVACILTMVGTGSEMNGGAVITNTDTNQKLGFDFNVEDMYPKFSILDPTYTLTLPKYQMVAGIYDIFNHLCEQYFSDFDDNTSDYIAEGLMRSAIKSGRDAVKDPMNYEARSNLMWTASIALNSLTSRSKSTDWNVHALGECVGAYTDATHGMTLAAVSMAYYKHILPYGLPKFQRFARNVWDVDLYGLSDEEVALEGLNFMEKWMHELGLVMNISELGVTSDMIDELADSLGNLSGGYKALDRNEIASIYRESL